MHCIAAIPVKARISERIDIVNSDAGGLRRAWSAGGLRPSDGASAAWFETGFKAFYC